MEKLWCVGISCLDLDLDKLDLNITDLRVILYDYDKETDELLARVCKKCLEENFKGLVGKFRVRKEPLLSKGILVSSEISKNKDFTEEEFLNLWNQSGRWDYTSERLKYITLPAPKITDDFPDLYELEGGN